MLGHLVVHPCGEIIRSFPEADRASGPGMTRQGTMLVLGIETTCDETAAAVVERGTDGRGRILSNVVLSQIDEHAAFGGVVPEIAARAHVEAIDSVIVQALSESRCALSDIDAIAV